MRARDQAAGGVHAPCRTIPWDGETPPTRGPSRPRGFALILTISLLAFIALLLLTLTVFTRIEAHVARNQQKQALARQHALLGLTLAIGQLQRSAGPDQRATARAAFLPVAEANKTQWCGVWGDAVNFPAWLVSTPPGMQADPTRPFTDPVILVGPNTAEVTSPATADPDQVRVEAVNVSVPAADYPGWSGPADPVIGRYAYWVGEEAGKPSLVLRDERSAIAGGSGPAPSPQPDPGPLWGGFDFASTADQAAPAPVLDYFQLGYVDGTAFSTTRLKRNYHRTTVTALGVPADAASGGLKSDGSIDGPNPYLGAAGPHFDATFFTANPPVVGTDPEMLPAARFVVRHRNGLTPAASALSGADAAAQLLVAGAFNLNSIDPVATAQRDRWRAVLSAAGVLHFPGGITRTLGSGELDALAAQLTATRLRSGYAGAPKNPNEPFFGVDAFARSALLQAALDATAINAGRTSTAPDYVSQEDLLALLAPILFVRSDTFVIRAYGEIRNPVLAASEGQAWCEAVLQRVADYVDPSDAPGAAPAKPDNQMYGRRFILVSFRWLTAADI